MDDFVSLQQQIRDSGLRIRVQGNQLVLTGDPNRLSLHGAELIRNKKEDLIAFLRKKCATFTPNIAPLTFRQEWHWQLLQEEGSIVSNKDMVAIALMLEGTLDAGLLARSIDTLVERHESLRTRVVDLDSIPLQQIDEAMPGQLAIEAVPAVSGEELEDTARKILVDFFSAPVDLRSGPLFRAKLLRLNDNKNILAVYINHMITDAVSMTRFFIELWESYFDQSQLRPRQFQFADYAAWQRSTAFNWHESFWREKLQGAQPVIWPTDKAPDSERRFSVGGAPVEFCEAFTADLQRLAKHLGTIPGLVLLSAYAVLIKHWCDQTDFVIPFVTNGRTAPEHAEAMGWFAYPLLIRLRIDIQLTFTDFTKYVVQEFMQALENADGGRLLLHHSPYVSEGTVFRWATAVEYQNASAGAGWINIRPDFDIKPFTFQRKYAEQQLRISPVPLALDFWHEGVRGGFAYRADLFSKEMMSTLAQSMRMTFEKLVDDPFTRIEECTFIRNP